MKNISEHIKEYLVNKMAKGVENGARINISFGRDSLRTKIFFPLWFDIYEIIENNILTAIDDNFKDNV